MALSPPYSLAIFDWDGTLGDSMGQIFQSIEKAARDLELRLPVGHISRDLVAYGVERGLEKLFPDADISQLNERFRHYYFTDHSGISLFPDVVPLLQFLKSKDITLAIATSMSRAALEQALEDTGIKKFFTITRTAEETQPKPNPEMINEILEFTNTSPDLALMIGDSCVDIQLALNAGVDSVWVSLSNSECDPAPRVHIRMLSELMDLLG